MGESRAAYMREYRAKRAVIRNEGGLMPFQSRRLCRRFVGRRSRLISLRFLSHAGTARAGCAARWWRGLSVQVILCSMRGLRMYWLRLHALKLGSCWSLLRQALGSVEGYRWRIDGVEPTLRARTRVKVISSDSSRALGLGANVQDSDCG